MKRPRILFLCTGNSCRSQMAEGWARHLKAEDFDVFSAGVETHGLNPNAVEVMKEVGVDISSHRSQLLSEFNLDSLDHIITVCGHARESCPYIPTTCKVTHKGFDDPPRLAQQFSAEEDILNCYRRVRDEIRGFIETLPESLMENGG